MMNPHLCASREQMGEACELRAQLPNGKLRTCLHQIIHAPDNIRMSVERPWHRLVNPFHDVTATFDPKAEKVLERAREQINSLVKYKRVKGECDDK